MPPSSVMTRELARAMTEISRDLNRQMGVLINRKGLIEKVILGDSGKIVIPALTGTRTAASRLSGLRLVHTHLSGEPLSRDDLTDLALLRLDLISAVTVEMNGLPGRVQSAHLIPENPQGRQWALIENDSPSSIDLDFSSFIRALEEEYARTQRVRPVEAKNRAILLRLETDPLSGGEESLDELAELARTAGVEVFDRVLQRRPAADPRYLLGRGKLASVIIGALQLGANLLIFDHELTPAQVRSIADITELRVIDRTQLILDIFAGRAHSREGKLQVELAQLKYLLPRLITKNTAMSRLTGGIGGRGPGETKLEINRRRVRDRIVRLERELSSIRKGRDTRRMTRKRRGLPVISIVGYTNAGKSTLLNSLTESSVFTEDLLFATLDPKSSRLRFPRDTEAIITDTVGFIRDLPRDLMAAFMATLEELNEADLLLHVIDVSSARLENNMSAVERILEELGLQHKKRINVFNKQDLLSDKNVLEELCRRYEAVAVSALDRGSLRPLLARMEESLVKKARTA